MANIINPDSVSATSSLSMEEKDIIEQKIDFEITKMHYRMIKIGAIANIIGGALFVLALYTHQNAKILFCWYAVMVFMNLFNMVWSSRYDADAITFEQLQTWRRVFIYVFAIICLTWSCTSILFITESADHQLLTFIFLLAVLVCFSLSSVTDFTLVVVGISCLLVPAIAFRVYVGLFGAANDSNLAISATLFICGVFFVTACYFGTSLIRKFFRLSLENIELNKKLENLNKFLELRVKQRTLDLENSLKMVTHQATHDLLTDLPNQRLLDDRIAEAIELAEKNQSKFAVIYFFINEIEKINESYGYEIGDEIINLIARRLQATFPEITDAEAAQSHFYITRSRNDNFILILEPIMKIEEIKYKVNTLFSVLAQPVEIEKHVLKLTASVGMSLYPDEGSDKKSLLKNASNAMWNAKSKGGNSLSSYIPENTLDFSEQLEMTSKLHEALANNEFILYYQPIVNLKTSQIIGVEALVRWYNPVTGFIRPDEFVPLAESSGVIIPLGEWVFRTACKQMKAWHDMGFDKLKIAINLSSRQLQNANVIEVFAGILAETQLAPQFVELELTESEAFKQDVLPILKLFKEMNLGLSIDDFGTGYSSLTNLRLIAIDTLKIDKSFISDIITNTKSQSIVSNTINLAKKMKMNVLAEGVETAEQAQFLRDHACDLVQGFYYSEPQDTGSITELLQSIKKSGFNK